MQLLIPKAGPDPTPERMFAAKYSWLMRWALHFVHNDRTAAEDLVQEVFVRMLLSWNKLYGLDNLEPILYSFLKYAHLTELRRHRSYSFQSLSTVDSDTLAMSLRVSTSFDQIEVQNELRSILTFLLWRRRSAKFASVFLLRFFHGFFPEEIASICLATRHSVDLSLRQVRLELKSYLDDPHQLQVPGRSRTPELRRTNVAVPPQEFVEELRREIFNCPHNVCPSAEELNRHYNSVTSWTLPTDILSHIVTCESCLDKVVRICGAPPTSARSMEDSLGSARRAKGPGSTNSPNKNNLAKIVAHGKRRMREICEHRPTGLVIALNGEVVAARDVSSACASLKAETRPAESLCFVEVFSEQGLLLLALPVPEQPPYSAPELTHALVMSDDRSLNLQVSFTSDGASIEAIYTDPHFASCDEEVEAQDLLEDERAPIGFERDSQENDFAGPSAKHHATHSWWRVLLERTRAIVSGRQPLVIVSVLIAVAALTWSSGYHRPERIDFVSSLHESLTAEKSEGPIARIPVSSADNANSSPESPLPH